MLFISISVVHTRIPCMLQMIYWLAPPYPYPEVAASSKAIPLHSAPPRPLERPGFSTYYSIRIPAPTTADVLQQNLLQQINSTAADLAQEGSLSPSSSPVLVYEHLNTE